MIYLISDMLSKYIMCIALDVPYFVTTNKETDRETMGTGNLENNGFYGQPSQALTYGISLVFSNLLLSHFNPPFLDKNQKNVS